MTLFDDDPTQPQPPSRPPEEPAAPDPQPLDDLASRIVVHPPLPDEPPLVVDPAALSAPPLPAPPPPDELPISWSTGPLASAWAHFVFFVLFIFGLLILFPIGVVIYAVSHHLSPGKVAESLQTNPAVAVGSNVLLFFLVFLFIYFTLAVWHRRSFWQALGWRKLGAQPGMPTNPWIYVGSGILLSICVALVSSKVKTPEHLPIEELFKSRTGAFLLMGMAVLIAPLVEETVFRGYLYPLFALSFLRMAKRFGAPPESAVPAATALGIILTGSLFGLLHAPQLGWTMGLVTMLITVGIVFTYARARTGTVLASFLMHLGYNSMIALSAIVTTHGFTRMPPHP